MTFLTSCHFGPALRGLVFSLLAGLAFSFAPPAAAQTQPVVPLFRFVKSGPPNGSDYYFYSTNAQEAAQIGFPFQKLAGYVFTTQAPGTVPLHRMYVPTPFYANALNRYLLATDTNPVSQYGYIYDGVVGYVYPGDQDTAGPFFLRFYSQNLGQFPNNPFRHFFTASGTESLGYRALNPDNGDRTNWVLDGTCCYLANPADETRFFVRQQFLDALGRLPDQGGWDAWTNVIAQCGLDAACLDANRKVTARGFLDSPEYRNAQPIPGGHGTPEFNREYVRRCYVVFLRREPDQGGWDNWTNYVNGSGDYDTLVGGFINSGEYYRRFKEYDRTFYNVLP